MKDPEDGVHASTMAGKNRPARTVAGIKDNFTVPAPLVSPDAPGGLRDHLLGASEIFLKECGLDPTPDAIGQLTDAFLPALAVICKRGYNPNGFTWRKGGWRGLLFEMRKKVERMWHRSWEHESFDDDSPIDLINYAGFYYRLRNEGAPWGEWGEPGSGAVSAVSMGDYSSITKRRS